MDREKTALGICEMLMRDTWRDIDAKRPLYQHILNDALALLKEQEAKQVEAEVINEIDRLYRCPSCHISMILRKQPYCHSCGQAVKWE